MSRTGTIKKKKEEEEEEEEVFLKFLSNGVEGLFSCLFWTENEGFLLEYLLYIPASRFWNIDLQGY